MFALGIKKGSKLRVCVTAGFMRASTKEKTNVFVFGCGGNLMVRRLARDREVMGSAPINLLFFYLLNIQFHKC